MSRLNIFIASAGKVIYPNRNKGPYYSSIATIASNTTEEAKSFLPQIYEPHGCPIKNNDYEIKQLKGVSIEETVPHLIHHQFNKY
jgi:hypothetical protein